MPHNLDDVVSIRDFAALQSKHSLEGDQYAYWAGANIPGFPDISKEVKGELLEGYLVTYVSLPKHAGVFYKLEGADTYVPVPAGTEGALRFNAEVAMSYSQQQFGALRANQPNLHGLLKVYRDEFAKFASNKLNDLIRRWKSLQPQADRKRAPNSSFIDSCNKAFDGLEGRNKNALAKGDDTAVGVERFKAARAAFFKTLNG